MLRWEGEERFAEEYLAWESDPFTFALKGGGSGLHVLARALPVIREIVAKHTDETVLFVSQKSTIRLVISSLLGVDDRGYRDRMNQHPCCLNSVDSKEPDAYPKRNRLRHICLSI